MNPKTNAPTSTATTWRCGWPVPQTEEAAIGSNAASAIRETRKISCARSDGKPH